MWEVWQSLTVDQKIGISAIVLPLLAGLGSYLGSMIRDRDHRRLRNHLLRADLLNRKLEILDRVPDWAGETFRREIMEVFGEDVVRLSSSRELKTGNVVCLVSAVPSKVRAEGIVERMGDIVLQFSGRRQELEVNIDVALNVNITNPSGDRAPTTAVASTEESEQIQGRLVSNNRTRFEGVKIRPGDDRPQVRIRNLRGNASQLGVPEFKEKPGLQVLAFVAVRPTDPHAPPLHMAHEVVAVGHAVKGRTFSIEGNKGPNESVACSVEGVYRNGALLNDPSFHRAERNFSLRFIELFEDAFRSKPEEGASDEVVNTGTRLMVRFFGIPEGLGIFVSVTDLEPPNGKKGPRAALVLGADEVGGRGRIADVKSSGYSRTEKGILLAQIPVDGGFGMAVWEWVTDDPHGRTRIDDVQFAVVLAARSGQLRGSTMTVCGSLAPISTVGTSNENEPVPRFIDSGGRPTDVVLFEEGNESNT